MTDVDAVATAVATGGSTDNPSAATPAQSTDAKGTASPDPWGTVDDGLRKAIEAKGWKAPGDVVKSYVELEKYASKTVQDMTPEEREKFVKRLGRPESPDGYDLNTGVVWPDWLPKPAKDANKPFLDLFHKVQALPAKDQPKAMLEWSEKAYIAQQTAARQAQKKAEEDAESELRKAWGVDYDANMAITERAAKLGGDEVVQWLNNGAGKNPVLRKYLLAVGKAISDEVFVGGDRVTEQNGRSGMVVDFSKSPELKGARR